MAKYLFALLILVSFLFSPLTRAIASDVVINEFLPAPSAGDEWVEFYNTTTSILDLANYYFDDDADFNSDVGSSNKVALSGILPAQTTCYWELGTRYLNNADGGDTPTLFMTNGTIEDSKPYTITTSDKSYSRIPDGGDWQVDPQTPTKSSTKCLDLVPTPTPSPSPTPTPIPSPTNTPTPTNAPTATPIPATATPSPTKKPTPTVTLVPTKTPTPKLTPTPTPALEASPSGEILGSEATPPPEEVPRRTDWRPLIFTLLATGIGLALLATALVLQKQDILKGIFKRKEPPAES